jgi:hypothetical protein
MFDPSASRRSSIATGTSPSWRNRDSRDSRSAPFFDCRINTPVFLDKSILIPRRSYPGPFVACTIRIAWLAVIACPSFSRFQPTLREYWKGRAACSYFVSWSDGMLVVLSTYRFQSLRRTRHCLPNLCATNSPLAMRRRIVMGLIRISFAHCLISNQSSPCTSTPHFHHTTNIVHRIAQSEHTAQTQRAICTVISKATPHYASAVFVLEICLTLDW